MTAELLHEINLFLSEHGFPIVVACAFAFAIYKGAVSAFNKLDKAVVANWGKFDNILSSHEKAIDRIDQRNIDAKKESEDRHLKAQEVQTKILSDALNNIRDEMRRNADRNHD